MSSFANTSLKKSMVKDCCLCGWMKTARLLGIAISKSGLTGQLASLAGRCIQDFKVRDRGAAGGVRQF